MGADAEFMRRRERDARLEKIARERIDILLATARNAYRAHPERAKRYVDIARRIGMKVGVRLPKAQSIFICKGCDATLFPGINCRVRVRGGRGRRVVVTCLECGTLKRFPTGRRLTPDS